MKTAFLAIIAAGVLSGCGTTSERGFYSGPTTDIVVTVTCSNPDTKFAGSIVTDGHAEQKVGTGQATFHATGHKFVCSFHKTDPDGQISISVSEAGRNIGSSKTNAEHGGVRAELLRTPRKQSTLFTTF